MAASASRASSVPDSARLIMRATAAGSPASTRATRSSDGLYWLTVRSSLRAGSTRTALRHELPDRIDDLLGRRVLQHDLAHPHLLQLNHILVGHDAAGKHDHVVRAALLEQFQNLREY